MKCVNSNQEYTDHSVFEDFAKSSYRAIAESPKLTEMQQLLQFLCRHAVKSSYLCLFLRCESDSCQHCRRVSVTAPGVTSLLRSAGNRLFTPTPSPYLTDHYLTFLECCFALKAGKPLSEIDEGVSKKQSMCQFGCKYVFLSKRDEDLHNHLVYPAELRTKQRQVQQQKWQSSGSEQQGQRKVATDTLLRAVVLYLHRTISWYSTRGVMATTFHVADLQRSDCLFNNNLPVFGILLAL